MRKFIKTLLLSLLALVAFGSVLWWAGSKLSRWLRTDTFTASTGVWTTLKANPETEWVSLEIQERGIKYVLVLNGDPYLSYVLPDPTKTLEVGNGMVSNYSVTILPGQKVSKAEFKVTRHKL